MKFVAPLARRDGQVIGWRCLRHECQPLVLGNSSTILLVRGLGFDVGHTFSAGIGESALLFLMALTGYIERQIGILYLVEYS